MSISIARMKSTQKGYTNCLFAIVSTTADTLGCNCGGATILHSDTNGNLAIADRVTPSMLGCSPVTLQLTQES